MKKHDWISHASVSLVLALAIIGPLLAGCTAPIGAGSVAMAEMLRSDKPRQVAPPLEGARAGELVAGNTAFALDLYRVLLEEGRGENLLTSPYSLSVALAMTYAGARGETAQQMAEALRFTLPQAELHPAFNALDQALDRGDQDTEGAEGAARLHIVNALWPQQGHRFLDAYLDALAEHYGAGLRPVDFRQSEEARQLINGWVSEETENKIQDLLPRGAVDGETMLVLTNAIYFNAPWMTPFAEEATADGTFERLAGGPVTVSMMNQVAPLGYAEGEGVLAVELPYAGGTQSMVVLVPDQGTFEAFAQGLEAEGLQAILDDLAPTHVRLALPKFSFDAAIEARDALVALGMVDAFGDAADLSGMDGTKELFIDQVYHKAFIDVDEAGTEAAAASAVVVSRKGPMGEQEVVVDRPFLFLIRDVETGTILFLGHVVDPA